VVDERALAERLITYDTSRAEELAAAARPGTARLPHFDVLLLGIGEDGHVASVFPEHPVAYETRVVSAVRGAPKPPPVRITLTLPAINTAEEVWLIAAGPDKASAVGMALAGAGPVQVPAANVHGVSQTLWLLDRAAAAGVPPGITNERSGSSVALTSSQRSSSHAVCSGCTRSRSRSPPCGTETSAPTSKRSFWMERRRTPTGSAVGETWRRQTPIAALASSTVP